MNRWRGQRALLQKEPGHHRGYFLVALLLLIYVPVLKSLYYLGQGGGVVQQWGQCLTYMLNFYQLPMGPPPLLQGSLHVFWLAVPILLGALLLGEERKGSLAFLVTTPVSRGDIVRSKFLAGSAGLLLAMAVNTVFLLSLSATLGVGVDDTVILRWGLIMSLGLIALFTLALFTSTFTASVLPAAGISFVLIYVPGTLIAMVENMAARYFNASQSFSIKAHYLANYLTITDYLTGEHWSIIQIVDHSSDWRMYGISGMMGPAPRLEMETVPLALAIIGLLGLAVLIFNRISLEEQGVLFASKRTRLVFIVLGGLLAAYVLVFPFCRTLPAFLVGTFVILGLLLLGERRRRRRRAKQEQPGAENVR